MLKFENPFMLYLLLALIPVWVVIIMRMRAFVASLNGKDTRHKSVNAVRVLRKRVLARSFLWSCGFILLVMATAGSSWGTKLVSVQITGNSVSFVFDVS